MWLREKNLPNELEDYCKNILDYLSQNMAEFIKDKGEDDSLGEEEQEETDTEANGGEVEVIS